MLSYSGLGLLSFHSLWGPSTETVVGFKCCTFLFRTRSTLPSSLRTKYWRFFYLGWYFPIRDSVYSLSIRGPSAKFLTPWKDTVLDQLPYLLPGVVCVYLPEGILKQLELSWPPLFFRWPIVIQHVQWTSLCCAARTQFAVPLTRIDPACPPGLECHLLRFLLTAVLSQEMNVSARVTLDTEFFCQCYAVQPRDFSLCRIQLTLDTVYDCWCYAFICWNACEVAGLAAGGISDKESSPSSDQFHALDRQCKSVPEYSNLCIRLNSSKIDIVTTTWLLAQLHLYHRALPSFRYSVPISFLSLLFSTLSALSISQAVCSTCTCSFRYNNNLRIQRSDPLILWILLTCSWHP